MKLKILLVLLACLAGNVALAQDAMTGMFRMSHTVGEVMGDQAAAALSEIFAEDELLQWQLYVPYDYDPGRPAGVLIYLDPNHYGGIPDAWVAVMNRHNLIWVGPRVSSRRQSDEQAVWHAVLGLRAVEAQYAIDLNRIYIASDRDTSVTAFRTYLFVNEVRGAIYIRGSVIWDSIEDDQLEQLRRKRHVFITGTNDPAKDLVRRHYDAYREAGIGNVKLIFDTRRIADIPDPEYIDEAIRFLDES